MIKEILGLLNHRRALDRRGGVVLGQQNMGDKVSGVYLVKRIIPNSNRIKTGTTMENDTRSLESSRDC